MIILKKIFSNFFLIILSLILIEIIVRIIIFFPTNLKVFKYGIDKNIIVETIDLSKLQINISDRKVDIVEYKPIKNFEKKKINGWAFGGSTTYGNNCGESSSWVNELQKKNNRLQIKNFAFNGADSDQLIAILDININKKRTPEFIIWASRFNMTNIFTKSNYRNKKILNYDFQDASKNKKYLLIKRVDKTLKSYLISYNMMDAIIIRLFPIKKKYTKKNISDIDIEMMVKNFEINTNEAIEISKSKGVKEFYLVSLFGSGDELKENNTNLRKRLYKSYLDFVNKKYPNFVKIIDLTDNLTIENKDKFLCDAMHQTLKGNIYQAYLINNFLLNNSIFFK